MKIVIGAGGTGGHLYPALAFVEYVQTKQSDVEICFVGTTDRLESRVVPNLGYEYHGLSLKGITGSKIDKLKALMLFVKSISKAKKILKEFKPDVVIGFGGYPSASVVKAAQLLKIKTIIHEQNSVIGLTNKILIDKADAIVCCYQKALEQFPKEKTYLYGNPRASLEVARDLSIFQTYNLNKKFVLVVMGSLGSKSVNEIINDMIPLMKDKNYSLLYVTGSTYYDEMIELLGDDHKNCTIVPYLDNLPAVLQQASLVVSRAGASTIAEITSLGIPSVLIPSPYVTANHQVFNALELVDAGASKMIEEKSLNSVDCINTIDELMNNEFMLESMKKEASKLGYRNACNDMYEMMMGLVGDKYV